MMVEAQPAGTLGPLAEAPQVLLPVVREDVVFAGDVEDLAGLGDLEHLGDGVVFHGLGKMGQIAASS